MLEICVVSVCPVVLADMLCTMFEEALAHHTNTTWIYTNEPHTEQNRDDDDDNGFQENRDDVIAGSSCALVSERALAPSPVLDASDVWFERVRVCVSVGAGTLERIETFVRV